MCVCLQKKLSEEEIKEVTEESDQTGDSGMETGSGTTEYGTVEEYKSAIKNPPILPGIIHHYPTVYKFHSRILKTCILSLYRRVVGIQELIYTLNRRK